MKEVFVKARLFCGIMLVNVFTDILYREQEMKRKNFFESTVVG